MKKKHILITGIAGFIGYYVAKALIKEEHEVLIVGIDNLNEYYDIKLKMDRLEQLRRLEKESDNGSFVFIKGDISDSSFVQNVFQQFRPEYILNLAAQAGVRYSISNPDVYIESNIVGFYNILQACRHSYDNNQNGIKHLLYASSSSVYGLSENVPYSTEERTDYPVSLYAATKKSNELLAYAYSKLYSIPATGLRFFTVYGPMGRPDMAYFSFTNKMVRGEKIQVYNNGDLYRDFTYIDDIITGIKAMLEIPPDVDQYGVRHKVYNIGNSSPENIIYFIEILEKTLIQEKLISEPAVKEFLPMQPGDVYQTYADVDELYKNFGFRPKTRLEEGISQFVKWYKNYYFREEKIKR